MIADISFPDLETRTAILKNKIKEKKIRISEDVVDYISSHIQNNIRELEGALNRVMASAQINKTTPNIKTVPQILSQIINTPKKKLIIKILSK